AVLYTNNDYGVALRQGVEAGVRAAGAQLVAVESFLDGDSDFTAQLTNIAAANPEALYIAGYYTEAAQIARQAQRIGLNVRIMGADGFDSPLLVELGGDAVEGALFTSGFDSETDDPAARAFIEAYEAAYGVKPDMFAAKRTTRPASSSRPSTRWARTARRSATPSRPRRTSPASRVRPRSSRTATPTSRC